MIIHREGKGTLFVALVTLSILNALVQWLTDLQWLELSVLAISVVLYAIVLQFFRNPKRVVQVDPNALICPADGKVVTIQEVYEEELLKDKRIQISIFMSPFNVHVNRYPLGGKVLNAIHHHGKFLVAWHPKSSTLNERTTVLVENEKWGPVLFRQIAGAVARRIVMYSKPGDLAAQGSEFGFIKFGSRVDLFLPLDSVITVKEGEVVKGAKTVIARRPA
jgi:phosphatidylserine decarboxylase